MPVSPTRSRGGLRAFFELVGCWSLAISWPVFQRLDAGSEVLTLIEARGMDLLLFTVLISLAAPAVLLLVELLVTRFISEKAGRAFHAIALGLLLGLVVWQVVQAHSVLALLALVAVTGLFTFAYLRLELIRNFALMLGIATPVVLLLFLSSYPIRAEVLPGKPAMEAQSTPVDTPVVMVVLDELPLAMLLDRNGGLDEKIYPELAGLARETTWYPRTLAVGDQTLSALPAIMTGEDAANGEDRPPPGLPDYPDNLCSITADAGYIVRATETITDFCPRYSGTKLRVSELLRSGLAPEVDDTTGETDNLTPGGIFEKTITKITDRYPAPPSVYGSDRPALARKFIDSLNPGPRTFDLLHLILPHAPFQFLPEGQGYGSLIIGDKGTQLALEDPETEAESLKHMQQNMAQTAFTLKLVDSIIGQMKAQGVWDESLFVLTADHGASFRVGTSRRTIREASAGWLLPVPLFIKYPGQKKGAVDRRFVTSKDIAPTVLGVLGLKPSPRAVGHNLVDRPAPEPDSVEITSTDEKDFTFGVKRIEALQRQAIAMKARGFGAGTLFAPGGRAGWLDGNVKGIPLLKKLEADFLTGGPSLKVDPGGFGVPAYVQANLPGVAADPGPIAVTVNGRVAATTRAWERDGIWMTGVNLSVGSFRKGKNQLGLYAMNR